MAAGGAVNRGFHRSEEFKRKVSEALSGVYAGERHSMYGTQRTEETKTRISEAQKGKPKSETTRQKMVEAAKRRWSPSNEAEREHLRELNLAAKSAKARRVLCVETGETFGAIREAARRTGVNDTSILRCCQGVRTTAGGFHWKYTAEVPTG